jgi:hypothetical protein
MRNRYQMMPKTFITAIINVRVCLQATTAQPVSTDERVQRALERRRQRLHAKVR